MSGYKGHITFFVILFFVALAILYQTGYYQPDLTDIETLKTLGTAFLVGIFFSIMPDLDIESSKARNFTELTLLIFIAGLIGASLYFQVQSYLIYALIIIVFLVSLFFTKHRGRIHSIPVGILFAAPLYFLFDKIVFITVLGAYISHLVLDKM